MKFNKEQSEAILDRGNDLLLSASAGTGKTAVLIERVCNLIIEDKAQIDQFLIVTFTEAAALELKTRISERLNQAIDDREGDIRHLSSQISLLPASNISTIHGFCKRLIQENFTYLEIEPDFKVADNSELNSFKEDAFKKALKDSYKHDEISPAIWAFSKPHTDDSLKDIVMNIYANAASSTNLDDFFARLLNKTKQDYDLLSEIKQYSSLACAKILELLPAYHKYAMQSNFAKYIDCARDDEDLLQSLSALINKDNFDSETYQTIHQFLEVNAFKKIPTLSGKAKENADLELATKFQNLRKEIQKKTKKLIEKYYKFSFKQLVLDIANSKEISLALIQLTINFSKEYQQVKHNNNVIDFDDMQQLALKILEDNQIAEGYQTSLKYIFVDEFQDTSDVQDALIERIRSEGSLFIVGDYKQSIYAFRKARPELFLKKYDDFAQSSKAKTIELNQNFRSLPTILDSVNDVFAKLMTKEFGGMSYNKMAMLKTGKNIIDEKARGDKSLIRFLDLDTMRAIAKENEALSTDEIYYKAIIKRVKAISNETYPVFDEAGNFIEDKKYSYGDICILSRSPNAKATWIKKIFEEHGIPLSIDIEENLFEVPEILLLVDFLKLVSNPKDDMALLSVMRSKIGDFTDDELFELSNYSHDFYADFLDLDYIEKLVSNEAKPLANEIKIKLKALADKINQFNINDNLSISHRLLDLIQNSNYIFHCLGKKASYSIYHAIEDFLMYIDNFESSGKYSLFQLLEHFDEIIAKDGVLVYQSKMQNESDSVKLLSIHKSKGLQFKYVIIQDMQKSFNKSYADNIVLTDDDSLVSKNVYRNEGIAHANPKFNIEKDKKLAKEALEEMRLLYVAMTRAESSLEFFAKLKLTDYSINNFVASSEKLSSFDSYLDWVLNAIDFKGFLAENYDVLKGNKYQINDNWQYCVEDIASVLSSETVKQDSADKLEIKNMLDNFSTVSYPELKGGSRKTVSQIKAIENKQKTINYAAFNKGGGVERGNAYHKFMHLFIKSKLSLQKFIKLNEEKNYLSPAELALVDLAKIQLFCQNEIYSRIKQAKTLWLEKPFVFKKEIAGEFYHLQGIIDLAFLDKDGKIVILDYKTDSLNNQEELIARYTSQLELYAEALAEVTNCIVKEAYLYSFAMNQDILLNINLNIKKN